MSKNGGKKTNFEKWREKRVGTQVQKEQQEGKNRLGIVGIAVATLYGTLHGTTKNQNRLENR